MESGDKVDEISNDSGHDECIAGRSNDIGKLDVQLLVSMVNPTTFDDTGVDAIETDDVRSAEDSVR